MTDQLQVIGLTSSRNTPSARFRVGQFVAPLAGCGVDLAWHPGLISRYPPVRKFLRPLWLPAALAARVPAIIRSHGADVTWFNREFISTLATLEGLTGRPRVFDVDDAIYLRRGGGFVRRLLRQMDVVVVGNTHLADWFSHYHRDIEIIPTAIDTDRFRPGAQVAPADVGTVHVGWMGSATNFGQLAAVVPALARVMAARPQVRFRVCADLRPDLAALPGDRVDFVPWSPQAEVPFLQTLALGIMPLPDSEWARGKCSFKMLLYMACGLPVVVSPVGMNAEVLQQASLGLAAVGSEQWSEALVALIDDPARGQAMGMAGRQTVVDHYSLSAVTPRLAAILQRAAGHLPSAASDQAGGR